ncbi:MAG: 2-oxoacid:ferredoxin oxidoreductase subunit gamma [Candidatus Bathyarchaeota archaeon]|jgi:2-oxoglutarate ferredoxin oxidoreductase subunit gamma|nr:2-oxoacid:ferredoxin oxidoreductase subunit gamma [Candidatus Bathyarchaeota archaeon A05DMB-5]MDH7557411.1 2-oxoacid:ferredoxin oxidoreductase subunit gamma [Candidatus Bathyarchaeota archaeon]
MRKEIRFAGFGGQGIIKSGIITAAAAAIHSGKNAVQTQSYGPESRGGACKSEVVISEEDIDFPKVTEPDVLVVMSQHAYNEYAEDVKSGGVIIMDPDMIPHEKDLKNVKVYRVPATKIAEELGRKIVANIVMLGAFVAITGLLDKNALKESIKANIPKGTEELNLAAFEKGYEHGKDLLKS